MFFIYLLHLHPNLFKHFVEHSLKQALGLKEKKQLEFSTHCSTQFSILSIVQRDDTLYVGQRGHRRHTPVSLDVTGEKLSHENINKTGINIAFLKPLPQFKFIVSV